MHKKKLVKILRNVPKFFHCNFWTKFTDKELQIMYFLSLLFFKYTYNKLKTTFKLIIPPSFTLMYLWCAIDHILYKSNFVVTLLVFAKISPSWVIPEACKTIFFKPHKINFPSTIIIITLDYKLYASKF